MCAAVFFVWAQTIVYAASPVVINEIMWDGTEYLELHNTTADDVALNGWKITRQAQGAEIKEIIIFDGEDIITANQYFLLEKNETSTAIAADKISSSLTLLNTGEQIQLLDDTGLAIDTANVLDEWLAGENTETGISMERGPEFLDGTLISSWHTSTEEGGGRFGTPGAANSEPKINAAPIAVLTSPDSGLTGSEILFSAEDSTDADGDDLSWHWDFGNSATADDVNAEYAYVEAGNFTITLTVSDGLTEHTVQKTIAVTKPIYASSVQISEFLPNPVGSDTDEEFIELYNTSTDAVALDAWQLDDQSGGSAPYTIPSGTQIGGKSWRVFKRSETKLALNNSGDEVRLIDPNSEVRASANYSGTVPDGQSYNRSDDTYVLSTTVTSGSTNVISTPVDEDEDDVASNEAEALSASAKQASVAGAKVIKVDLPDVRAEDIGSFITTEGVISVPPGIFGPTMIYLAGSGIQVYYSKGEFPPLKLGDKVKLTGELSTIRGESRLKIAAASDIVVQAAAAPPVPHVIKTGDVDEAMEGSLVTIAGRVTQTSGDTFYVDDASGEARVYIKTSTAIDKPKMKQGMAVTITGIISETTSGYRVLPRWQEDIRFGLVAGLQSFPATGFSFTDYFFQQPSGATGILGLILAAVLLLAYRAREPLLFWS